MSVWYVLLLAFITAVCTGLGALPFLFIKNTGQKLLGVGNALAAGLMTGASIGLVTEAASLSSGRMIVGLLLGVLLILIVSYFLPEEDIEQQVAGLDAADTRKILLVLTIMTVHSFAEGIGVGVAFGGKEGFGELISLAIAVHNIPEGIAISLVLIPRGASVMKAALWSIFSSLPQPLMAVPAFLFVQAFQPALPIGLGIAAGAMFYMVYAELLPEALESIGVLQTAFICAASIAAMLAFQLAL